jgi:hypothetical protein
MGSRVVIPQGARVECDDEGVIPTGPNAGQTYAIRLWLGMASRGYRSGYEAIPHRWLEISHRDASGKRVRHAWSYSGRRFAKGLEDFRSNVEALNKARSAPVLEPIPGGAL